MVLILYVAAAYVAWSMGWWAIYTWRIRRLQLINERFHRLVQGKFNDEDLYKWLVQRTNEFHRLLSDAEVPDGSLSYAEPVGGGYVATGTTSAKQNWLANRSDTAGWTYRAIQQAIGHYSDLRWQSLNPLHWLAMLLTLPQQVIKWVGGPADSTLGRFLSVVWAILLGVAALTGFTLRDVLFPN